MRRKRRRERRRRQKLTENRELSNNTRLWSRSMSHFSEVSMARSDNDSDDSRRKSKKKKSKRWDLLGWTIINSNFCMWWGTVRQINKSNIEHLVSRNYKPLYKRRIFFFIIPNFGRSRSRSRKRSRSGERHKKRSRSRSYEKSKKSRDSSRSRGKRSRSRERKR